MHPAAPRVSFEPGKLNAAFSVSFRPQNRKTESGVWFYDTSVILSLKCL
jgi:hypothetical protein